MPTGTATLLFTDLVDSTATLSRLGEEAGEELRQTHFRLLREPLGEHGGEEVKNLGDGLMVVFSSVSEAVGCAVAMQQAVARHNERADTPLGIRMGLAVGEADRDGDDFFGPPVVEAARLCAKATGGQILITELVRMLAGSRGDREFRSVGELELKGLPDPVATHEVVWEPADAAAAIPLPDRLTTRSALALFGRTEEQEQLRSARKRAAQGELSVVLLAGEPGIGKTRLASEAALEAHGEGVAVLFGRCDEDLGLPYQPFVEALRHLVAHAPADDLGAHVASHGSVLARLVPELAQRLPDAPDPPNVEAESERYLLFDAVVGMLATACAHNPLVLVLDDLHWAGKPTLLLLKHLVGSATSLPLLVIGTYRDTDISRGDPLSTLLADFRREDRVERLPIQGLSDAEVVAYVEAIAGHELDADGLALAHALRRETEGSPFFMIETLRHLRDSGAVFEEDGRWTYRGSISELGIPESVREVIGHRLERLSPEVNQVLTAASVVGPEFELDLLVEITGRDEDELLDDLEAAVAAAVLAEVQNRPGWFAFPHALVRHTLYEGLSATRRARLHRQVAETLETRHGADGGPHLIELAHHWYEATKLADVPKAMEYARRAGDQALDDLAYEEAASQYARALEIFEPVDDAGHRARSELLLALGDAQRRAGDLTYRETFSAAFAEAAPLGDGESMAHAALGMGRPGNWFTGASQVDDEAVAMFEAAVAVLSDEPTPIKARALSGLAVQLAFAPDEGDRRRALYTEAEAIAREAGDPVALAQVLSNRYLAEWHPFTLTDRVAIADEMVALGQESGQAWVELHGQHLGALARFELGDCEGLDERMARSQALAEEIRTPFYRWIVALLSAGVGILRDPVVGEGQVMTAAGLQEGNPDAVLAFGGQMFALLRARGQIADLLDTVRDFIRDVPGQPAWKTAIALALLELGDRDGAAAELEAARAEQFSLPLDYTWPGVVIWAEVAGELADAPSAEVLIELIEPHADKIAVLAAGTLCVGAYARYLGMLATVLGRDDDAERWYEQALDLERGLGLRTEVVSTQRHFAELLAARHRAPDRERATAMAVEALVEAEALGMVREVERLGALIDAD